MLKRTILLFFLCLLPLLLCTCDNTETIPAETRSLVFAPTEITLPDSWVPDALPEMQYNAASGVLSVGVHYDLPPLEDGFIPSEYSTAHLDADGMLLSIDGCDAYGAGISGADDFPVQHTDALIGQTYRFADGTALAVETLYTENDAGLWTTLFDSEGNVMFSVSPADYFDYNLSRDIGAHTGGGDIFMFYNAIQITKEDGTPLYCFLTSEGLVGVNADSTMAWVLSDRAPRAMIDTGGLLLFLSGDTYSQKLSVVDAENGSLGEEVTLPEQLTVSAGTVTIYTGDGYDLYVKNHRGLYGVDMTTNEEGILTSLSTQILDWTLCDLAPSDVNALAVIDPETIYMAVTDQLTDADFSTLYRYDLVPPEEIIEKHEMILAKLGDDNLLEFAIRDFNRTSDTHRIVVRDYTYLSDYETMKRHLDTDIAGGNTPDILIFSGQQSGHDTQETMLDIYTHAGLFTDLKAMMQADASFDYDGLLSCVTDAFEYGGAQYVFPLSYSIRMHVGHPEDFLGPVTAEEMLAYYGTVPENQTVMEMLFDMQRYLLYANIDSCYDEETAACTFDDGTLLSLLEGSGQYAEYLENRTYLQSDIPMTDLFRAGDLRIHEVSTNTLSGWAALSQSLGEFVPIGYPNADRALYADIHVNAYFSIAAESDYQTEAFAFLKILFALNAAKEYDNEYFFASDIDHTLARYDGKTIIENGAQSQVVPDDRAAGMPGLHYKLTQADADAYKAFLNAITRRVRMDTPAAEIFWDEFAARGEKTYAEMLSLVQSRAFIYLSEQLN